MKKKLKKSFLESENKVHKFDAFNVINNMLFVGVLVGFIILLGFAIKDVVLATNKNDYIVPIIERVLAIIVVIIPLFLRKVFKIAFPKIITTFYYLFLFLSIGLGTFIGLFDTTEYWDIIVHFLSGVFFAFVGMFFVKSISEKRTEDLKLYQIFIFLFVFAVALGALWEIYEFCCDLILDLNMQKYADESGVLYVGQKTLVDTMLDIIFNAVGALISSIICCVCCRKNKDFVSHFKVIRINKEDDTPQIEE